MKLGGWACHVGALACAPALVAGSTVVCDTVRTREIVAGGAAAPVLHFDFAEGAEGVSVVSDASGHGRHGVCAGCTWRPEGRFAGGALAFAGNASSLAVPDAPAFPSWERYTAGVWFKYDGRGDRGPQYGLKMLDRTAVGHDWHLSLRPSGHAGDTGSVGLSLFEDGRRLRLEDASRDWGDGAWHHLVVVRDGARGELWVDGVRRATTGAMFGVAGRGTLCVGNSRSADLFQRKGWSGELDEVRVYDRVLDGEEIARLFASGTADAADGTVTFAADVAVGGALSVAGPATFAEGIRHVRPQGDLSLGAYTDGTVPDGE